MLGGGVSMAGPKLTFTLPISCQICLEKVKDPVTCPKQHVFCNLCLELWLQRSSHCPVCRADITPQTPVRKIIGGMPHSQDKEKTSPGTSKHLRRTRMKLLMDDYESEIDDLRTEITGLKHTNEDLRSRLKDEEKRATPSSSSGRTCNRCRNMQDIDSMLEMAKNLQDATKTFGEMKKENEELKLMNEKLAKDYDDLKRQNVLVREEVLMRSPMKFGRLTVAAMEKRVESYEKQVAQLQKALEKNDAHTEQLLERLKTCSCSGIDTTDGTCAKGIGHRSDVIASTVDTSFLDGVQLVAERDAPSSVSQHDDIVQQNKSVGSTFATRPVNIPYEGESFDIANILPSSLSSQCVDVATTMQTSAVREPNNTAAHSLGSSFVELACSSGVQSQPRSGTDADEIKELQQSESHQRDLNARAKCFTAQMMPPPESPDYGNKLRQIQNNLLHPITTAADSTTGQSRSFSRRLCFDRSASPKPEHYSSDSAFVRLQSPLECTDVSSFCGLADTSSNPLLTSPRPDLVAKPAPSPILDAGNARITAGKLVQNCRDVSARPSSAPSRTFLLSGSRFSAITPMDPQFEDDDGPEPKFQPVKTRSPSSLSLMSPLVAKRNLSGTPLKEGLRYKADGSSSRDPLLKLVSPDEVISINWREGPDQGGKPESPSAVFTPGGSKGAISRVGILKRNVSVGKPGAVVKQCQVEEGTVTPSRKNSRKQCLSDHNNKRLGDNSLEFLSPVKCRKVQTPWDCS